MKAALLVEAHRVEIDDVPDPIVGPDDVLVRVDGVGLCGSDFSVFSGKWESPSRPWIMGHEAFGEIVATGERVPATRIGETVVVEPNVACLTCVPCSRGLTSACERRQSVGMNRPGALAELLAVPTAYAWRAEGLPAETLVCVEPLTVSLAALRRFGASLPDTALVVGAGPQGLLMLLALLARGVQVRVHDPNPERAAFAQDVGAVVDDGQAQFSLIVDTVGSPQANQFAVSRSEAGAAVLVLGLDERPLALSAQALVRKQLQLRGSLTYDHPLDFAETLRGLRQKLIDPRSIVTSEFPLAAAQTAFEQSPTTPGKTWIRVRRDAGASA